MNLRVLAVVCSLTSSLSAQAPFADGDLIVASSVQGAPAIVRVDPGTGATSVLAMPLHFGGWAGAMTFDSYRGRLLANVSLPPDGTFTYRLWRIAHDGTASAVPGITGSLRALCSAGDGRVFFQRHTSMAQGPKPVEYLDAADTLHTLLGADGVTPFEIEVEHLLYHAPTNALIGSSSNWWSATDCGSKGGSLYRIPLASDGTRVDGPVTCASISDVFANEEIMALDHLPDGRVLVTVASGLGDAPSLLLAVDPTSLAITQFADPKLGDLNGGVWSTRLQRAVLHVNDGNAPSLRLFAAGDAGPGQILSTATALPGGSGFSPVELLFEVDVNGPGCMGLQAAYGNGLAGSAGYVPHLSSGGCPDIGKVFTIEIAAAAGGAAGMLFAGLAPAALPFKGGEFLVGSLALAVPIQAGGVPGQPGAGSLVFPATLTDPVLAGVDLHLQAAFADGAAAQGVSLTNGLHLRAE